MVQIINDVKKCILDLYKPKDKYAKIEGIAWKEFLDLKISLEKIFKGKSEISNPLSKHTSLFQKIIEFSEDFNENIISVLMKKIPDDFLNLSKIWLLIPANSCDCERGTYY